MSLLLAFSIIKKYQDISFKNIQWSTTSIKTQGDSYPHEVVVSILIDSNINKVKEKHKEKNSLKIYLGNLNTT
jgi:hypothetical protein